MNILKRSLFVVAVLLGFIIAGIITLCLVDWNHFRKPIATLTQHILGRPLTVSGELTFTPSMRPALEAHDISLPQPSWAHSKNMLHIKSFRVELDLPATFRHGAPVINTVSLDHPQIILEQAGNKKSWAFKSGEADQQKDANSEDPSKPGGFTDMTWPLIKEFQVKNADFAFIPHAEGQQAQEVSVSNFSLTQAHQADGSVTGELTLNSEINQLPLNFEGKLIQSDKEYSLTEGLITADQTRIFLASTLKLLKQEKLPYVQLDIEIPSLDLHNLQENIKAATAKSTELAAHPNNQRQKTDNKPDRKDDDEPPSALDKPLPVDLITLINSDITVSIGSLSKAKLLKAASLKASTRDGQLDLDHVTLTLMQGKITTNGRIATQADSVKGSSALSSDWSVTSSLEGIGIQPVLQALLTDVTLPANLTSADLAQGVLYGNISFTSHGAATLRQLIKHSNGSIRTTLTNAQINAAALQILEFDAAQTITSLLKDDKTISVSCAVNIINLKRGVLSSEASLLATEDTSVFMRLNTNLLEQQLTMTIIPIPKSLSVTGRQTPIFISGPFKDLSISLAEPEDVLPKPPSIVEAVKATFSPIKDWETMLTDQDSEGGSKAGSCGPLRAEIRRIINTSSGATETKL